MASIQSALSRRLHHHLLQKAKHRTTDLRLEAITSGWPEELAHALTIKVNHEGHYIVGYPKHLEHKILTQEYGTEDTPPSPVIRNFMAGTVGN